MAYINGKKVITTVKTVDATPADVVLHDGNQLKDKQYNNLYPNINGDNIPNGAVTPIKTDFQKSVEYGSLIYATDGTVHLDALTATTSDNVYRYTLPTAITGARVMVFDLAKFSLTAGTTYTLTVFSDNFANADIGGVYLYDLDINDRIVISTGTRSFALHSSAAHTITFTPTNNVPNGCIQFLCIANVTFDISFTLMLSETNSSVYEKPIRYMDKGAYDYFNEYGFVAMQNLFNLKNKYRYLVPTFLGNNNATNSLILLGTNDLHTFDLLAKKGTYIIDSNISNAEFMRDPAIIQIKDYYYITYSISMSGNKIGMCRTKDFVTYETLTDLTITNSDNYTYVGAWAPAWFRENDNVYIIVSGRKIANQGYFDTLLLEYNYTTHTLGVGTVLLDNLNGIIDGHLYKYNGNYYIVTNSCGRYKATTLTGEYTKITGKGGLPYTEGEFVIKLDNGKYRIFAQGVLGGGKETQEMYYTDVDDIEDTLSIDNVTICNYTSSAETYAVNNLPAGTVAHYWHWTIFDFNNRNDNNNNFV